MAASLPQTYKDIVCVLDMNPNATETTSDLQSLVQDVFHILLEFPGSNPDDVTRGIGMQTYLSATQDKFQGLPGKIEEQLKRDTRITSASCVIEIVAGSPLLKLNVQVGQQIIPLQFGYIDGQFTNLTP